MDKWINGLIIETYMQIIIIAVLLIENRKISSIKSLSIQLFDYLCESMTLKVLC